MKKMYKLYLLRFQKAILKAIELFKALWIIHAIYVLYECFKNFFCFCILR